MHNNLYVSLYTYIDLIFRQWKAEDSISKKNALSSSFFFNFCFVVAISSFLFLCCCCHSYISISVEFPLGCKIHQNSFMIYSMCVLFTEKFVLYHYCSPIAIFSVFEWGCVWLCCEWQTQNDTNWISELNYVFFFYLFIKFFSFFCVVVGTSFMCSMKID